MGTKVAVAVAFVVLLSLGLSFEHAPASTIIVGAISVILGFMVPDLDRFLYPFWPQLRLLVMLMAGLLFAYSFTLGPTLCYFFAIPMCNLALPFACALLIATMFVFDFLNPSKPPFHSLIAMASTSLLYALILSHLGYVSILFLATGAFAAAYTLHYLLEAANVDRSQMPDY
jgi:hypothetical protein